MDKATRIAIVGGGFAGLALAWHLATYDSEKRPLDITLYEAKKIGAGASGIAAGLLHPYGGKWAKINPWAREGIEATLELVQAAEKELGYSVILERGLLRFPVDEMQWELFKKNCGDECSLLEQEALEKMISFPPGKRALSIPSAYAIECSDYLKGLALSCEKRSVRITIQKVPSLASLECDIAVAATGAYLLPECSSMPIRPLKGQLFNWKLPSNWNPLPSPIMGSVYLVEQRQRGCCIVGASFEKQFSSPEADIETARHLLLNAATQLCPSLNPEDIMECRAGVRATTPNHLPLYQRFSERYWICSGLGSKGLLYHAFMGRQLAQNLIASLPS